jgi:hypothetical protein
VCDEFAHVEWSESAHASLTDACPHGRVYLSTPLGEDNAFARIRNERPRGWIFKRFHWSEHPVYRAGLHIAGADPDTCDACRATLEEKRPADGGHRYPGKLTSPWYEDAISDRTDEQVAQELDIDYAGSLPGRVYPEFSRELHVVDHIGYDRYLGGVLLAWDYGLDTTAIVICQESPMDFRIIGIHEAHDSPPHEVVAGLKRVLVGLGVEGFMVEQAANSSSMIESVGDPAGEGRDLSTGRSVADEYRRLGWPIQPARHFQSAEVTINAVKRLLGGRPKPLRACGTNAKAFIRHIEANRWPADREGRRRVGAKLPLDDAHNHALRGLAYLVYDRFPAPVEDHGEAAPEDDDGGGRLSPSLTYDMSL